jgi:hypothetical protein
MKRRDFLKKSSLYISGTMLAGMGVLNKKTFANSTANTIFSLDVATDQPELAIQKIDRLLKSSFPQSRRIEFMQYQLSGNHIGDIVFVKSGNLIDFYNRNDPLSIRLRDTAKTLALPKSFENPALLRFYSGSNHGSAKFANIFSGEVLIHRLPLDKTTTAYHAAGEKGHIDVAVKDGSAKIVSASCKHKTCMELGAIDQPGQSLVCIPSRMRVVIEGSNNYGVDGITF